MADTVLIDPYGAPLAASPAPASASVLRQALPQGLFDAEDVGYQRLTGAAARDLAPPRQDRMIEIAAYLYRENPLAKWLLEITRDFILAEGVSVHAEDEDVQEVIDAFWDDPINAWDLKLPQKVLELALFGEQLWPVAVNEASGLVRLATVDPSRIAAVEHDPDNAEAPIGVRLRGRGGMRGLRLRILYPAPDAELFASRAVERRATEYTDGECFFWSVNKVSTATRGVSDLLALADWLDGYEQFLFNTSDRVGYLNAFVWDIILRGMDAAQIRQWLQDNPAPKPGSMFAHNENVEMEPKTPSLQGADMSELARVFRHHILGGASIASHWYGGAEDVNLATAQAMGAPTYKWMQARQRLWRHILTYVVRYQLAQAQRTGKLKRDADLRFDVLMPQLQAEDVSRIAVALTQVTSATLIAEQQSWIDAGTAQRLFAALAARFGVDVPLDAAGAKADARVTPEYRRKSGATANSQAAGRG